MSGSTGLSQVMGEVLHEDHEQFRRHSGCWNLTQTHAPNVIVIPRSEQDVRHAVAYAAEHALAISTQCTGHNMPRSSSDAVLIKTERLAGIAIDPATRRVVVQAGVQMRQLAAAAHGYGLMPLCGSSQTVGVTGYLLGGGFPLLAREYGLAMDSVVRFRTALADGEIVDATQTQHADLFWALQGGGGAFGVVLEVEMELIDGRTLYGGNAIFDYTRADELFPKWLEHAGHIPEDMSTSFSIMHMPPLPFVPEPLRGKSLLFYTACAHRRTSELDEHFSWARSASPMMADFSEMTCLECGKICRDPEDPVPANGRGVLLRGLSQEGLKTLTDALRPSDTGPWYLKAELRKLGGAVRKMPRESPLTLQRSADYLLYIVGPVHPGNPAERIEAGLDDVLGKMAPWIHCDGPLGFLPEGKVTRKLVRNAYSDADYQRLLAVKMKYDPENRFRFAGVGII